MENFKKIIIYFLALNSLIVGIDKFFLFIPESCSLLVDAPKSMLYSLGVIEIVLAILLFFSKYRRIIFVMILVLMISAIVQHLINKTYDIAGALFISIVVLISLIILSERD